MEVKISRVDPTLACEDLAWSSDGVLALATTNGVILFEPDGAVLASAAAAGNNESMKIQDENQWHRHELGVGQASSGSAAAKDTVSDVAWSPSLPGIGCILAALTNRGVVYVASSHERHVWKVSEHVDTMSESPHCITWNGPVLLVGTSSGKLMEFNFSNSSARAAYTGSQDLGSPVLHVASAGGRTAVALGDNSVKVIGESWELKPSKNLVSSLLVLRDAVVVAQTGRVTELPEGKLDKLQTHDLVSLAHLDSGKWIAITAKAVVQGFPALQKYFHKKIHPHIQMFGIARHPSQPLLAIVYDIVRPGDLKAPILSTQSARLLFISIDTPERFQYGDGDALSYWFANAVQEKAARSEVAPDTAAKALVPPQDYPNVADVVEFVQPIALGLLPRLEKLFTSPWFDEIRLRWAVASDDDRNVLITRSREAIGKVLEVETAENAIDEAVIQSFTGRPAQTTKIEVSGGFFTEQFDFSQTGSVLKSENDSTWKRCDVTLLPLLTLDARVSSDGLFAILPSSSEVVKQSRIAKALIEAAGDYCPYNGTRWLRRPGTT